MTSGCCAASMQQTYVHVVPAGRATVDWTSLPRPMRWTLPACPTFITSPCPKWPRGSTCHGTADHRHKHRPDRPRRFRKGVVGGGCRRGATTNRLIDLPAVFVHEVRGDGLVAAERRYWGCSSSSFTWRHRLGEITGSWEFETPPGPRVASSWQVAVSNGVLRADRDTDRIAPSRADSERGVHPSTPAPASHLGGRRFESG